MAKSVKGLQKLISVLERIPKELDGDVEKIVEDNARQIELESKRICPVGTPESTGIKGYIGGTLRQSIKALKIDAKTYKIMANSTGYAPYGIYVEHGTYKMKKQPFLFPSFFKQRSIFIDDLEDLIKRKVKNI